jgi:hypothetical protein
MLTTKPPSEDQIEVAIRALEHVLPATERSLVEPLPSAVVAATAKRPPAAQPEDLPGGG